MAISFTLMIYLKIEKLFLIHKVPLCQQNILTQRIPWPLFREFCGQEIQRSPQDFLCHRAISNETDPINPVQNLEFIENAV